VASKRLTETEVEQLRGSPEVKQLLEMGVHLITAQQKAELEHARNRLALLRRYIIEPELSSDASLRANIATVMGWRLPASYWLSLERSRLLTRAETPAAHTAKDQVDMCEDELRALPAWRCRHCEEAQLNSGWATACGRCGAQRLTPAEENTLAMHRPPPSQAEKLLEPGKPVCCDYHQNGGELPGCAHAPKERFDEE
jgi:hypothetical protein